MQDDKWQEIIGRIQDDFEVSEHETKELDPGPGTVEYIIFNGPLGKVKLERTTRPLVLGKHGLGSRRIGSQARVEYQYSDTETIHTFRAYKWDGNQNTWVEMEMERGGSFHL